MSKKQRIEVQRDTIQYINKNRSKFKSKIIKYTNNTPNLIRSSILFKTQIIVTPDDTLEAVAKLILSGSMHVGFLVFANATNPGGTPAQEESICRRTNLVDCFNNMNYPIPEFKSFYIKDLAIIRDSEKNKYKYLNKILLTDCVVAAAYHSPPTDKNNKLCDGYKEKTKIKIKQILNAFIINGKFEIVLGAFGCGAFNNPVNDIANLFKEILSSDEYKDQFKIINFAVMKDMNGENYKTFVNILSK